MEAAHSALIRNLKEHSQLAEQDIVAICSLPCTLRSFEADEDFIRQGERPDVAAVVVSGMVARYHLLSNGRRQYLSFHIAGDMPDAQGLFIERMDHGLSSLGPCSIAFIPHKELVAAFGQRLSLAFAIWRATLLDAALFREAITNNSARPVQTRMAHLFCELFYRARTARLTRGNRCKLPISLLQLGEALGMSIATVNRSLQQLRASATMDFRDGELTVFRWRALTRLGDFDADYLHVVRQPSGR